MKPVREVMDIVFEGDQLPGLSFWGLRPPPEPTVEFPASLWPLETKLAQHWLFGDAWRILWWDVVLPTWPTGNAFAVALNGTFDAILQSGCVAAWVSPEGRHSDPPNLFKHPTMSQALLAAKLADGRSWLDLDPDLPPRWLSDEVLAQLRKATGGLSDAEQRR